jgi:release factor glutamine methyltransferase
MTIAELIRQSGLPCVEAEVLVASVLQRDRAWVVAHEPEELGEEARMVLTGYFARRRSGEPVAYITGEKEFYGRLFRVTPAVLIPRPSTENLVDSALAYLEHPRAERRDADAGIIIVSRALRSGLRPRIVVDVGTGSGCIAVTLALEGPDLKVIATDVSAEALKIARGNAEIHGVLGHMDFRNGADLEPVQNLAEPFLLVSNLPYISEGAQLPMEVQDFEPPSALFAGADGMDVLRRIARQARAHPHCAGIVAECRRDQVDLLLKELSA